MFTFDGSYDSGGNSTLFNHEKSWTMNLTYMHRLFKDKFTLLVAFNDVFHTDHGNNWTMKYNNIKTSMHTNGDTRSLIVKLSYNVSIQNSPSFVDTALLLPLHKKDVCTE